MPKNTHDEPLISCWITCGKTLRNSMISTAGAASNDESPHINSPFYESDGSSIAEWLITERLRRSQELWDPVSCPLSG